MRRYSDFDIPCVVVSPLVPGKGTTPLSTCEERAKGSFGNLELVQDEMVGYCFQQMIVLTCVICLVSHLSSKCFLNSDADAGFCGDRFILMG